MYFVCFVAITFNHRFAYLFRFLLISSRNQNFMLTWSLNSIHSCTVRYKRTGYNIHLKRIPRLITLLFSLIAGLLVLHKTKWWTEHTASHFNSLGLDVVSFFARSIGVQQVIFVCSGILPVLFDTTGISRSHNTLFLSSSHL